MRLLLLIADELEGNEPAISSTSSSQRWALSKLTLGLVLASPPSVS
jgi:hypothetical protein